MIPRLTKYALFAAYQLSVAMSTTLLPVMLTARQMDATLLIRRLVGTTGAAYERTAGRQRDSSDSLLPTPLTASDRLARPLPTRV